VIGPTVAVVGSAAPGRTYDPPMHDVTTAATAAEEVGRELAKHNCRLVVYSSAEDFIESSVVRGFARSGAAKPKSIEVRSPLKSARPGSYEEQFTADLFDLRPDATNDWEVSFYRSLFNVDAVVLIGGGRSTFIAGLITLSRKAAVAPIAAFGGAAEQVWQRLNAEPNFATEADISAIASGTAEAVVTALLNQHQRRVDEEEKLRASSHVASRRKVYWLLVALLFLILAIATIPAMAITWQGALWAATALLVAGPLFAGMSGALIRGVFDESSEQLRAAVAGAAAGGLSGILFVAAQLFTNPDALKGDSATRLIFFVVAVGFAAGLAFDAVLAKLRGTDVTQTSPIEVGVSDRSTQGASPNAAGVGNGS
jgi:hypothetical protein